MKKAEYEELKDSLKEIKGEIKKLSYFLIREDECNETKSKIAQENLSKKDKNQTFKNFNADIFDKEVRGEDKKSQSENMVNTLVICDDFIRNFEKEDENNLLLYGPTGTGKTYLTNCIANELIPKGFTVRSYSAVDLFQLIGDELINKKYGDKLEYNMLYECDLLIIDNLGSELVTDFTCSQLLNILTKRESNYKKTIITTNLSPQMLRDAYTDRIFSRMFNIYHFVKFIGIDLRWLIPIK